MSFIPCKSKRALGSIRVEGIGAVEGDDLETYIVPKVDDKFVVPFWYVRFTVDVLVANAEIVDHTVKVYFLGNATAVSFKIFKTTASIKAGDELVVYKPNVVTAAAKAAVATPAPKASAKSKSSAAKASGAQPGGAKRAKR